MRKLFFTVIIGSLFIVSCFDAGKSVLEKDALFKLTIGKGENEIDLVQLPGVPFTSRSRIVTRNGLIYISNGNTDKIMEFTSYGDIISMIYNADTNPQPFLLSNESSIQKVSNKRAVAYPFNDIGEIAVSPEGDILVDDKAPPLRMEFDKENEVELDRIVLMFSRDGSLKGYLGQEGLSGKPFPYIEKLQRRESGDTIVFTRTPKSRLIFWFDVKGNLLYKIPVSQSGLPFLNNDNGMEKEGKGTAFLDSLTADCEKYSLYLKIDYYSGSKKNQGYKNSVIWELSAVSGEYTSHVVIPPVVNNRSPQTQGGQQIPSDYIYSFLGCDKRGSFYFFVHLEGNNFQLLVLSPDGSVVSKSSMEMDDPEISYSSFYLTEEGLLAAMLAKEDKVDIVWWRSDRLTGALDAKTH